MCHTWYFGDHPEDHYQVDSEMGDMGELNMIMESVIKSSWFKPKQKKAHFGAKKSTKKVKKDKSKTSPSLKVKSVGVEHN